MLKIGAIGTIVTTICCFTPVLGILFGVLGLGSVLKFADFILLPLLVIFVGLTVFALARRQKAKPD